MINSDGSWVETIDLEEAKAHGNYATISEEIIENIE